MNQLYHILSDVPQCYKAGVMNYDKWILVLKKRHELLNFKFLIGDKFLIQAEH